MSPYRYIRAVELQAWAIYIGDQYTLPVYTGHGYDLYIWVQKLQKSMPVYTGFMYGLNKWAVYTGSVYRALGL